MIRRIAVLSMLIALLLGAGGTWRQASFASNQAQTIDVAIRGFAFQPNTITIPVGTTVRWTNEDSAIHTATSDDGIWDSGNLSRGQSFSFTFTKPGTFGYHCTPHGFTGKVVVTGTAAEEVQEFALIHSLKELKLFPGALTVKKGVKVKLFNIALDGAHPSVAISSDADGKNLVFGVKAFNVETGKLTTVEFTPDKSGEFFISHRPHGHDIVGKLSVKN